MVLLRIMVVELITIPMIMAKDRKRMCCASFARRLDILYKTISL